MTKKKAPPRPEELDDVPNLAPKSGSARIVKTETFPHQPPSEPRNDWTPEDGGYRDGRYYGPQNPGGGHYPAANGATHEDDFRICPKCGMQRTFQIPPEWGEDYCKEKDGTYLCNGCSGRNLMRAGQM
jgi:hypothetical protein